MRELIRPTLFLVARLGLFLSVVAWIVGQWWVPTLESARACILLNKHGFVAQVFTKPVSLQFAIRLTDYDSVAFGTAADLVDEVPISCQLFSSTITQGLHISAPHWFVITIFALFYGVLMWVYRKRGKELAVDE